MAADPDPDEVFRSTDGKANFQRLARLVISGGTSLLREIFDAIHPPSNLPTILSNAATKKQLKAAKLTKPQWDCLYPSPGVYGKSTDFDVTLLFRLLRTICSLRPAPTGWDALPPSTDLSLTADLTRIKYYRNSVYGHVSQKMEIPNDQFLTLWQEISEALVRIAGQISPEKKTAWQKAIDDFRKDPLTADDERNIQELERWYMNDMHVKKSMKELTTTTQEGMDRLERRVKDFQVKFEERTHMIERGAQCLETAVREEAKDINDYLEEMNRGLIHRLIPSVAGCRSTGAVQLQNDYEDTEGTGTQGRATGTSTIPQEPLAEVQGATVALITTGTGGENGGNKIFSRAPDVLSTIVFKYVQSVDLSRPEEFITYLEYMERMRKVLFNHGDKILKELWKNYRTGDANKVAQTFLEAENFLKEHGLIEEYTACRQGALKPPIQLWNDHENTERPGTQERATEIQEPQAVVQGATVAFLSSKQPQELITAVTNPASMKKDENASDLPENQELLNQIREQFVQLHRLRKELHSALLRWIQIRARTFKELESLLTKFHKRPNSMARSIGIFLDEMSRPSVVLKVTSAGLARASEVAVAAVAQETNTAVAKAINKINVAEAKLALMASVSVTASVAAAVAAVAAAAAKAAAGTSQQLRVKDFLLVAIAEDCEACIELGQRLDSLEKFISTMAEILKPFRKDPVLLRQLEGPDSEFGTRFFRTTTSAATTSSSADATASVGTRSAVLTRELVAPIAGLEDAAHLPQRCINISHIRTIVNTMRMRKLDEEEIQGLVESFIDEKFTEAGMMVDK